MKRRLVATVLLLSLSMMLLTVSCVNAKETGTIRIDPPLPTMVSSPAIFDVWVQPSADPTTDPHIFLVMTESCYLALTGKVKVEWSGGFVEITLWSKETVNSVKVPPGTTPGAGYTVASLKDHLGTTEPIYWAFVPFLSGPITQSPQSFTVTLPSTAPKMLVYALGKTGVSLLFNNRVPPTIPGFVIPEPATIAAVAASSLALIGFAVRKRKQI